MRGSEKAMLLAVRNAIRAQTRVTLETHEVQVEHDEIAPATIAHQYIAVMPGGWLPGPRHKTSGGVWDMLHGVEVTVVKRVADVPRDRMREAYLEHIGSLDSLVEAVIEAVDFSYVVMNAANTLIVEEWGTADQGFMHPLMWTGCEKRPRIVDPAMFSGTARHPTHAILGLGRLISFTGARRIVVRR